jgi:preprotein translocase subunit SecE
MTNSSETRARPAIIDTALLAAAGLVVLASIVAYYYFEDASIVLRVVGILAGFGAGAALLYQSRQGQVIWQFIVGSRVEIRKVIWPNRQETVQTTITVFIFLLILGVFFWSLDFVLLMITRAVTGQGA